MIIDKKNYLKFIIYNIEFKITKFKINNNDKFYTLNFI